MAHEVLMPKLSSTMSEGTITTWLKNEGDAIEVGDAIFEVMTDKIAIEVEAYEEGILLKRYIQDGESAPVNSVVAYIGTKGEEVPEKLSSNQETNVIEEKEVPLETKESVETVSVVEAKGVRATPAARRIARQKGLSLLEIKGTGPKNRVQAMDVKKHLKAIPENVNSSSGKQSQTTTELVPWSGMRKVIAERMTASKTTIPHVTMNAEVDMTQVIELRKQLLPMIEEQTQKRVSFLEIIAKATMVSLKTYPIFNAHGLEEGIQVFKDVNLAIAVAVSEGLLVPVIPRANEMGLSELTKSVKEVTMKARNGQLAPSEMSGATFTISSLGQSKVKSFNPIINVPEVAILGIGGLYEQLVVDPKTQELVTQSRVTLSLSFDHRIVDGAPAAQFLTQIVTLLENPLGLLL